MEKITRFCTSCKKPAPARTTFCMVTGKQIIKPGEELCHDCYNERRYGVPVKVVKRKGEQLKLF